MLDNLRAMAVFASVVQYGSFSGAGRELGITTSAISQQIRALELELGVVLLHRSTRKLSLTEAGASLYQSAKAIVACADEARDNINQLRDGILGNLRMATTPLLARQTILPALSAWLNEHSELSLTLVTDSVAMDMIETRADLAVYLAPKTGEGGITLSQVPQLLVTSPTYLATHPITELADLSAHAFILPSLSEQLMFSSGESVKVNARYSTQDEGLALALAVDGCGIACTNHLYAQELLASGRLVAILPEYKLPKLTLYAKTPNKAQQPAKVNACLDVLVNYFA